MRRVIVLGGLGLFGRTAAEQLRRLGAKVQTASRSTAADLQVDTNERDSIHSTLRAGDVMLDAAGPFHARSTALIEAAIEIGFDVIDINDNLSYAESVDALEPRIAAAGIRILSSASSVSAISAAIVRHSGISEPRKVTSYLAPASRHTANAGAALSLIQSVGRPVRLLRDGRLQTATGWSEPRNFPMPKPIGTICGRLFETADSFWLPRTWPTLREVAMYVDTNTPGMNLLLRWAASSAAVRGLLQSGIALGTALARRIGSSAGGIGYAIEDANGQFLRYAIASEHNSFLTAVAPAVLAAKAIADDRFSAKGLILPACGVEPAELFGFLADAGIFVREAS